MVTAEFLRRTCQSCGLAGYNVSKFNEIFVLEDGTISVTKGNGKYGSQTIIRPDELTDATSSYNSALCYGKENIASMSVFSLEGFDEAFLLAWSRSANTNKDDEEYKSLMESRASSKEYPAGIPFPIWNVHTVPSDILADTETNGMCILCFSEKKQKFSYLILKDGQAISSQREYAALGMGSESILDIFKRKMTARKKNGYYYTIEQMLVEWRDFCWTLHEISLDWNDNGPLVPPKYPKRSETNKLIYGNKSKNNEDKALLASHIGSPRAITEDEEMALMVADCTLDVTADYRRVVEGCRKDSENNLYIEVDDNHEFVIPHDKIAEGHWIEDVFNLHTCDMNSFIGAYFLTLHANGLNEFTITPSMCSKNYFLHLKQWSVDREGNMTYKKKNNAEYCIEKSRLTEEDWIEHLLGSRDMNEFIPAYLYALYKADIKEVRCKFYDPNHFKFCGQ